MAENQEKSFEKDLSAALSRLDLLVKIFEKLINKLKEKNKGDTRWFIFGSKIGKKFLTHTLSIHQLYSEEIYYNNEKEKTRFIDFGSMFSLLRIQLENYAVFLSFIC